MIEPTPIRVLLVDDHAMVRRGLATFLKVHDDLALAGEAATGEEAVRQCGRVQPDVVLMDLVMPECDGKQALGKILSLDPAARVVILSSLGGQADIEECLKLGAKSYLQKPIDPEVMDRVLHEAVA